VIGIFGGTFDPVHLGHLRLALSLVDHYHLEEVRFVPCKQPVHKQAATVSAEHRLAMLKLAVEKQPNFIVDDREIKRSSPSYMIETLQSFKHEMPTQVFGLILGSDALAHFTSWYHWQEIIKIVKLLIVPRPSFGSTSVRLELQAATEILNITTLPISSSHIRAEIKAGHSPRYWIPDSVWDYINSHQLYR
jgi:nicotinate-nucleotide adenylyltransferase